MHVNNKGSGKSAHVCRLTKVFAASYAISTNISCAGSNKLPKVKQYHVYINDESKMEGSWKEWFQEFFTVKASLKTLSLLLRN